MCPEKCQTDIYICPEDISNKLDKSINDIIEKAGFVSYEIEKKCVSTNGGNYLGILYEIDIKGKTKDEDKELNIFVKSVIPGQNVLEIISVSDVYKTEVFTYKELAKIFEDLQKDAQVPINERYKMVNIYDETDTEIIIMENITRKGFSTGHRMDVVSLKFAEMAMQELAKFHALSFVLKAKRPEFFDNYVKTLKCSYISGDQWYGFVDNIIKMTLNYVDEDVKERVAKFSEGIADRFMANYGDETANRSLCHGDYRPNNIMTKMMDGEVSEIIPVDYQLVHYGCPILDIFYFIFSCTDQKFRRAHLFYLKNLYYQTMKNFLEYFDLDLNLFYPREEFDKDYKEKLNHGLMIAVLFLPFMFALEDDLPDITKDDMAAVHFNLDDRFRDRIRGVIEDFIEWGVI